MTRIQERQAEQRLARIAVSHCGQPCDPRCQSCLEADKARNQIVMSMVSFLNGVALPLAMKQRSQRLNHSDLVQHAISKILQEFHRFRPELGMRPITYFGRIAYNAMLSYVGRDGVLSLPPNWYNNPNTVDAGKRARGVQSMEDQPFRDTDGMTSNMDVDARNKLLDNREAAVEEQVERREQVEIARDAISKLRPRLRQVVEWRMAGMTLVDIAGRMKICKERVRQLERQAYKKMKDYLQDKGINL